MSGTANMEWDTAVGEARASGRTVPVHADALAAANGYRSSLFAGEEMVLCVRPRLALLDCRLAGR